MNRQYERAIILCTVIAGLSLTSISSAQSATVYEESFDTVWRTIDQRFYDEDFNGVDWTASLDRFREKATASKELDDFYLQVNTMLFELGASHLGVVPSEDVKQLGEATVFGEGDVGVDIRFVDQVLRIVNVAPGSAAANAGLVPGVEVVSINGRSAESVAEERKALPVPPFTARNANYMTLNELYWELMGPVEDNVRIEYRDPLGEIGCVELAREPRGAAVVFDEGLPSTYVEFEYRKFEKKIGYLKFNTFHPEVISDFESTMAAFSSMAGVIIDLRGNPGGAFAVRHRFAGKFVSEPKLIWQYRGRGGLDDIYLEASDDPYLGNVAILVDGMSASSSEEFAGGLQAMDRATIIGERTSGRDLVADIQVLPVNAYFVFPVAETITVNGDILEGRGVIPDIEVLHDLNSLTKGIDLQLEAALTFLRERDPE